MIRAVLPQLAIGRRRVRVPGSKSYTNRALLLAAAAPRPVVLRRPLASEDTDSLLGALRAIGASVAWAGDDLRVAGSGSGESPADCDVADSGTACRFVTAFAAVRPGIVARVTGSARLRSRPIGPLVDALRGLGARIDYEREEGFPPIVVYGRGLSGGEISVTADLSSQFASALLLAGPLFSRGIRLEIEGRVVSRPYVDLTIAVLKAFGIAVRRDGARFEVDGGGLPAISEIDVPGDYSAAIPLAAAAAISGGEIELAGLAVPSPEADARALEVLAAMGARVTRKSGSVTVGGGLSSPIDVDASDFPDAVPALAAAAATLDATSRFAGVGHLRLKESDRLSALAELLGRSGARATAGAGDLVVEGARRRLPCVDLPTFGDHRMAMAAALLCLEAGGSVLDPWVVGKSYPAFFRDLYSALS